MCVKQNKRKKSDQRQHPRNSLGQYELETYLVWEGLETSVGLCLELLLSVEGREKTGEGIFKVGLDNTRLDTSSALSKNH